jgi:phosphoribosylaminoimidazolecarboxamide formyltransferase/IMP cyclohydrolase
VIGGVVQLRYGLNPHQTPAYCTPLDPARAPFTVRHGSPSYLNVLDAVTGWQLVREASRAFGRPAAASFKHVSPAGAALGATVAEAYARARSADPTSSYGDFVAVSGPVDRTLAELLQGVVSDGIIAPGFEDGVLGKLAGKKRGTYLVLEVDPDFEPPATESREIFGLRLTEPRDALPLTRELFPEVDGDDLLLGMIVLRYTQSNSVAYLRDGMTLGVGAGQQSRIDCTRIAGEKTAGRGPIAFVSDGALPFIDNVEEAHRHGVRLIAEPGGSIRSGAVREACERLGITLVQTGVRLFRH